MLQITHIIVILKTYYKFRLLTFRKNKIREAEKPQSCQKSDFILTSSQSVPFHDEK